MIPGIVFQLDSIEVDPLGYKVSFEARPNSNAISKVSQPQGWVHSGRLFHPGAGIAVSYH